MKKFEQQLEFVFVFTEKGISECAIQLMDTKEKAKEKEKENRKGFDFSVNNNAD